MESLLERKQKLRWVKHFSELLNRSPPTNTPDLKEEVAMCPLHVAHESFTITEMKQSFNKLRNNCRGR
jgi:hypothetical protein